MKKKLLLLLMVITMSTVLAACKSDKATGGKVDMSEHVEITYMTTGNKPTNGKTEIMMEKLNAILKEKVNATLKIYWIEWTDYMTTYNLTLAQNDGTVDLVGTATDWLDAWPNVKKGAFLELSEDMLKTYAPKTWESVPQEYWDMCKYEGEIYLIPEDNYAQWINHGFMYRMDWAKEAGLANGVHSWSDLGKYFQYIKDNKEGVIPWDASGSGTTVYTTLSGGWISSHTDDVFIEGLEVPLFYGNSKDDLYTVVSPFYEGNELVEFAKTMKAWADAGYWRTDVLNYSGETREEFYIGHTGADQHHTQTWYTSVRPKMDETQPGSDVGFFYFGEETQNLVALSITHGAMAVASSSKNPERALMVYDLLRNDEECYRLFNYGIEGEQYIIKEDGTMDRPEGFDSDRDSIQTNFWWGRNDDLELLNSTWYNEGRAKMFEEYSKFAIPYPYGQIVFNTNNVKAQMSNLSDVYNNYMPRIAFGKVDDAEAFVAEFRDALKAAGIEDVIKELQKQMDEFYK
ncbi:MAG: extracellular solute-binding protein [Clostridiales bacterium]|nr:extracellular solute-binding protein [Clostridiales bacterium]